MNVKLTQKEKRNKKEEEKESSQEDRKKDKTVGKKEESIKILTARERKRQRRGIFKRKIRYKRTRTREDIT